MKKLLLIALLIVGCAVKLETYDDLEKMCQRKCEQYEGADASTITDDEGKIIQDPYCACLRWCMDSDTVCISAEQITNPPK